LAVRTRHLYGVPCEFRSRGPAEFEGSLAADHLYRIAQEAATNAINHGAPSQIRIALDYADGALVLQVTDNGTGLKAQQSASNGIGLRNMHYRGRLDYAELSCSLS
jgi:two-component system NarL family sensor kinase